MFTYLRSLTARNLYRNLNLTSSKMGKMCQNALCRGVTAFERPKEWLNVHSHSLRQVGELVFGELLRDEPV